MQLKTYCQDGVTYACNIPDPDREVVPGVQWDYVARPFSPAFWRFHCVVTDAVSNASAYRLGDTLRDETTACLLGGHGITGELGNAAFLHLRGLGLTNKPAVTAEEIEQALRSPILMGERAVRYRFPRQKARFVAAALNFLDRASPPAAPGAEVRNWLTQVPGVGMKTASWIVRNWLDAADVAILDIHIHRAGVLAGIFEPHEDVTRSYASMEARFLDLARAIEVPPNVLDNQMWNELRLSPAAVRKFLIEKGVKASDRCGLPAAPARRTSITRDLFAEATVG